MLLFLFKKSFLSKIIGLFLLLFIFAACGTSRRAVSDKNNVSKLQKDIVSYSKKFLGTSYRHAGKGPRYFDCSGYTSFVFRKFGYKLSAGSNGQDKQLPSVKRIEDLQVGDLVFFEGRSHNGKVGHVGIVTQILSDKKFKFIHASSGNGVIISSSSEPYYALRYLRGGRVLKNYSIYAQAPVNTPQSVKNGNTKNNKRKNAFILAKRRKEQIKNEPKEVKILAENYIPDTSLTRMSSDTMLSRVIHSRTVPLLLDSTLIAEKDIDYFHKTPSSDSTKNHTDTIKQLKQDLIESEEITLPDPIEIKKDPFSPLPITHVVKPGETLYAISRKYNCSVEQIKQWNPQLNNVLKSGEKVLLYMGQ